MSGGIDRRIAKIERETSVELGTAPDFRIVFVEAISGRPGRRSVPCTLADLTNRKPIDWEI